MTTIEELRAKAQSLRAEADEIWVRLQKLEREEWLPKHQEAQLALVQLQRIELREQIRAEIQAEKANQ